MRRNERYIVNGRIVRDKYDNNSSSSSHGSIWRYASWKRIGIVTIVSILLMATNPGNDGIFSAFPKHFPGNRPPMSSSSRRRLTNYGLFSVQEERLQTKLRIFVLAQSWSCSYVDSDIGSFCEILGVNMAHGKPLLWDPSDLAHTAHRILCGILILSSLVFYCFPNAPRFLFTLRNPILDGLVTSVFYRPDPIFDLLTANLCVYRALSKMSSILPDMKKAALVFGSAEWDFALYVVVLVIFLGGGCNMMASYLTDRRMSGFSTTVAASLAYVHRAGMLNRNPLLFYIQNQPITALGGYWSMFALNIITQKDNAIPFGVAWLLAGIMGSALAKYHVENVFLLGDVFKFFGLT